MASAGLRRCRYELLRRRGRPHMLGCRYALENLLEARLRARRDPRRKSKSACRAAIRCGDGVVATTVSIEDRLGGAAALMCAASQRLETRSRTRPHGRNSRRAAHHERYVKSERRRRARPSERLYLIIVTSTTSSARTHPGSGRALLEPCNYTWTSIGESPAQQDALDVDQLYPSEAGGGGGRGCPEWCDALGPRRGGPRGTAPLATRAVLVHGPAPSRGEATAESCDGVEWSAPLVLPTRYDNKLEGTALRYDDDAEAADGASTRGYGAERSQRRLVYDLSLRVEVVGTTLAWYSHRSCFRNHTDGVLGTTGGC